MHSDPHLKQSRTDGGMALDEITSDFASACCSTIEDSGGFGKVVAWCYRDTEGPRRCAETKGPKHYSEHAKGEGVMRRNGHPKR